MCSVPPDSICHRKKIQANQENARASFILLLQRYGVRGTLKVYDNPYCVGCGPYGPAETKRLPIQSHPIKTRKNPIITFHQRAHHIVTPLECRAW